MTADVICPYCSQPAVKVTGREVYPHRKDLYGKVFYVCALCDARVGCHPDGTPFGRMANKFLRNLRIETHAVFDALWRGGGMSRDAAYALLAKHLNMMPSECHIGNFGAARCLQTIKVCRELTNADQEKH